MKYNPKINEEIAALPAFTHIHPLQPEQTVKGCEEVATALRRQLAALTGMHDFTLKPCAGAHGELTGLMIILIVMFFPGGIAQMASNLARKYRESKLRKNVERRIEAYGRI